MIAPGIGITADDLTGAADTAAAFARPALPVAVSLGPTPRSAGRGSAVAVNADSRARSAEEAYALTRSSIEHLLAFGADLIYKKADSNLRGKVGPELAALADALGRPVFFAPAFPSRGRTVVGGVALLGGRPVADTDMGRDPEAPVVCSRVAELLRAQRPELAVTECPLAAVRAGVDAIAGLIPNRGVLVLDAETDEDLAVIAQAAISFLPSVALAGSAGLARALAELLLGPRQPMPWRESRRGPILAILASASPALAAQVERAAQAAGVSIASFRCESLSWEEGPVPEVQEAASRSLAELDAGRTVVIHAAGPLPRVEDPVALVVEHLAHLAFVVVKEGKPRGLLVGGGATAQAVLHALGAQAVAVDDEPEVGMAAGILVEGHANGCPVALKPGAAGTEESVVSLLDYLGRRAAAVESKE